MYRIINFLKDIFKSGNHLSVKSLYIFPPHQESKNKITYSIPLKIYEAHSKEYEMTFDKFKALANFLKTQ